MEEALFPFMADEDQEEQDEAELPLFREYLSDDHGIALVNGRPVILEGLPALELWMKKVIRTQRDVFAAYSVGYGCELDDLIGQGFTTAVVESEAERMVQEAFLESPYIERVDVTSVEMKGDTLTIACEVTTVYGEVEIDV